MASKEVKGGTIAPFKNVTMTFEVLQLGVDASKNKGGNVHSFKKGRQNTLEEEKVMLLCFPFFRQKMRYNSFILDLKSGTFFGGGHPSSDVLQKGTQYIWTWGLDSEEERVEGRKRSAYRITTNENEMSVASSSSSIFGHRAQI